MSSIHTRIVPCLLSFCALAAAQHGALRVTEPSLSKDHTIVTTEPSIQLKGTLAWGGGDMRVLWKNQRGFSELATVKLADDNRTVEWSTTAPVPLRPGINQVSIRALGQPGAEFVNVYYSLLSPPPPPRQGAAIFKGRQIAYEEIDGMAVYQSDMVLGTPEEAKAGRFRGRLAEGGMRIRPEGVTIAPNLTYASGLWPIVNGVVRVPYSIENGSNDVTNIDAAIAESNTQLAGVVQWVPASGDTNYVSFNFTGAQNGSCESVVGMQGGSQTIGGSSNCGAGTILHEMGHALGLYHEQSRTDRNTWVNYSEANVDKPEHGNFDIVTNGVNSGLYNYASIMEYGPFAFSRYGVAPTLETIPAGMVLGTDLPQYTTGDLDSIERLYGFLPTKVTVDSNPSGLQLVVDSVTCTAPCVFSNWTLGSQHTLSVAQTIQTLGTSPAVQSYLFGRWNSDSQNTQAATVTITNSAGSGSLFSPTTSPAVTAYLASFIPLHPYNPQTGANNGATGSNTGTVGVIPSPYTGTLNGVPNTSYFKDRQYITLSATPKSGYTFYAWTNVPLPTLYAPFLDVYLSTNLDYMNFDTSDPVTAFFVNDAVTTVTASSSDIGIGISPGFSLGVTENSHGGAVLNTYTPRNFDASQDGIGFAAGSSLTFCGSGMNGTTCPANAVPQSPSTPNMVYLNYQWNGYLGGTGNSVTLASIPANGAQVTLDFSYSFRVVIVPSVSSQFCSGVQVSTSPAGTNNQGVNGGLDAFYTPQLLAISATGDAGVLNFSTWSGDLGGSGSPYEQTLTIQTIATANYNVPGTTVGFPLAVTGITSPAIVAATNNAAAVTFSGSGFLNGSTAVFFDQGGGQFVSRTTTVQSSTQMTVQFQAGDLSTVGYNQILVQNNASVSGCDPQTLFTFAVSDSNGAPALSISKMHNGVFGPSEQNAQYTILVTNTGTASTSDAVTVADTLPAGETLVSMTGQNGSGWSCNTLISPPACTNSTTLAPQTSYGLITVTVNVAANATSPQVNTATVSGGGSQSSTATDSTEIVSSVPVPNVVGDVQATAETAISSAGLTTGQVTMATSPTVPAGEVIGSAPSAGTLVAPGSAVGIVVSIGATATLQSITVSPATPSIAKGLTQQFAATGHYSDNSTQNLTAQVDWVSGTTATATITSGAAGGVATALATGTSNITATLNSVTGSATLTVTPAVLLSLAVTPANPSIVVGATQQFAATGTYTDNTTANLTGSVTWSSGTLATASITSAGKATALRVGTSTIGASLASPALSGSTTLTVTALSPCDVNVDGIYSIVDAQAMVNEALGLAQALNDLNGDHVVNVVDIQIVLNAILRLGCTV